MQLGMIGLGKMGKNMRDRIRRSGHEVVGYDSFKVEDRDVDPISGVVRGVLTDHRRRWSLTADAMIDTTTFPPGLSDTVNRAVAEVVAVLQQIRTGRAG